MQTGERPAVSPDSGVTSASIRDPRTSRRRRDGAGAASRFFVAGKRAVSSTATSCSSAADGETSRPPYLPIRHETPKERGRLRRWENLVSLGLCTAAALYKRSTVPGVGSTASNGVVPVGRASPVVASASRTRTRTRAARRKAQVAAARRLSSEMPAPGKMPHSFVREAITDLSVKPGWLL